MLNANLQHTWLKLGLICLIAILSFSNIIVLSFAFFVFLLWSLKLNILNFYGKTVLKLLILFIVILLGSFFYDVNFYTQLFLCYKILVLTLLSVFLLKTSSKINFIKDTNTQIPAFLNLCKFIIGLLYFMKIFKNGFLASSNKNILQKTEQIVITAFSNVKHAENNINMLIKNNLSKRKFSLKSNLFLVFICFLILGVLCITLP